MDRRTPTEDRRKVGRPRGGRRVSDPIHDLTTHRAEFVEVSQLADYWGKHVYTVHAYIRQKRLVAVKVGGTYRIKRTDAVKFERNDPEWQMN
jgi:excisionase family DNA binding protein